MGAGGDRSDLNRLYRVSCDAAIGRIEKDGHFQPLVFELRESGAVQHVAVLDMGATNGTQSVLQRLLDLLRPRIAAGTTRAVAIVRLSRDDRTIETRLRAARYSADIIAPYGVSKSGVLRRKRIVTLGEATECPVPNDMF